MKKLVCLLLVGFLLTGCALLNNTKTYTSNGISVTMDSGFYEKELVSQTVYLESKDAIFTALKEDYASLAAVNITKDSTLKDYTDIVKTVNGMTESFTEKDGLIYATYEKNVSGKDFFYLVTAYKTDDAFWLVNFACNKKDKAKFEPKFIEWAKTVEFK